MRLTDNHMAFHRWAPTPYLCNIIQQMFMASGFFSMLHNLHLEGKAIEIITESLSCMAKTGPAVDSTTALTPRELMCLQRARDIILARLSQPMTVESIAHEAGASASSLQRLFRRSEGRSVFEYIRIIRLEQALSALRSHSVSVQEASILAGYSSPTSFATAFKRQFGVTPREISVKSRCFSI